MSKPRKKYRPTGAWPSLMFITPMSAQELAVLESRFGTAIHALATYADPGAAEFRDVADMLNTIEALALQMGKLDMAEVGPTLKAGTDALAEAAGRWKQGKRMGLSGAGLEAMRDLLAIYVQCARGLTGAEMAQAAARVREVYRLAHAGKLRDGREAVIV